MEANKQRRMEKIQRTDQPKTGGTKKHGIPGIHRRN